MSTVNLVYSHGLKNRQFCEFSSEIEAEYTDLPYHTAVCNFFKTGAEINIFLSETVLNYFASLVAQLVKNPLRPVIFFFPVIFSWFWYQGDCGLAE